ncbi:hypothetical protein F383_33243 [Gossypium arboreum]|uniref:Uncharacterized protein n=1 Tax=Gossypium arboreum TaxID=29729 RepID=A0A0B0MXU1_GOSAR|nr:hypothetical protein F383_33243 [Gossypium arboreum]
MEYPFTVNSYNDSFRYALPRTSYLMEGLPVRAKSLITTNTFIELGSELPVQDKFRS